LVRDRAEIGVFAANNSKLRALIARMIENIPDERGCPRATALKGAVLHG
jgi:hypothetical protein